MPKLAKNYYYNSKGERKVNCYLINVPKKIAEEAGITDNDNVEISANKGKIIIKKV